MRENKKLENKLKGLEGKDDNEHHVVKLTVAQVKDMLKNGGGETRTHVLYKGIIDQKNELERTINEQFKKTEIQKYKEQLQKYVGDISSTIDALEKYTYFYVDKIVDEQVNKMDSMEKEIIELFIVEDELDKTQVLNKQISEKYKELESKYNETIKERDDFKKKYEDTQGMLDDKEEELEDVQKQLTTATGQVNKLLIDHKGEIDSLNKLVTEERNKRVSSEQITYEIQLKEKGLQQNINDEKERVKEVQNQLEELRKEKDAKIEGLFNRINKLELQLSEDQAKIKDLEEKSKNNDETIKTLGMDKSKLELQVANLEQDKKENNETIKAQVAKNGELETDKTKLELQVANLEKNKKDNDEKIKIQEEAIDKLQTDKKKLDMECQSLKAEKQELEGYKKDSYDLKVKMDGLEKELNLVKNEKEKTENKYNELFKDYKELANNKVNNNLDNEANNKIDDKVDDKVNDKVDDKVNKRK